MKEHNWKEAEKELRTCASMPPPVIPQVWQALGLVLENQGKFSDARSAYYAALKDNPLYVPSMLGLSRVLLHLGLPSQAVEAARTATSFGQSNPSAWYTLGNVLKETGNTKDAEEAYRHALSLQSDDPSIWNDLGTLLVHERRGHEAEQCFRKAIAIEPDFSKAWSNLGQLLKTEGDKAGALKALEQALKTHADPGDAYSLAFSLETLGDRRHANEAYRLGLEMTPEEADVLLNVPLVLGDKAGSKGTPVPNPAAAVKSAISPKSTRQPKSITAQKAGAAH
jgi:Flp pilus assembly protein TadD